MVAVAVVLVVGLVYGLGSLCFVWWDGGILRRALMILCVLALIAATFYAFAHGLIPVPHSSSTYGDVTFRRQTVIFRVLVTQV